MIRELSILKYEIKNPRKAFDEISKEGKAFLIGALVIIALPKVISGFLHTDFSHLKGIPVSTAEWIISVILLYFIGRSLKGEANFTGLLSSVGYARFPLIFLPVLGYLALTSIPEDVVAIIQNTPREQISQEQAMYIVTHILTPVTVTLSLIMLVLLLWNFALSVIAVRESNKFSTWRAFCSAVVVMFIDMFIIARILKAVTGVGV